MENLKKYTDQVISVVNCEEKKENEYINCLLNIIQNEIPVIQKYNGHLSEIISLAIELVLDQSARYQTQATSHQCNNNQQQSMNISEETKREVDEIISEIGDL